MIITYFHLETFIYAKCVLFALRLFFFVYLLRSVQQCRFSLWYFTFLFDDHHFFFHFFSFQQYFRDFMFFFLFVASNECNMNNIIFCFYLSGKIFLFFFNSFELISYSKASILLFSICLIFFDKEMY